MPQDTVNQSAMTDIHDIKPALAVGPDLAWLLVAAAVIAMLVLGYMGWRRWRNRKQPGEPVPPTAPRPPEEEALEALEALAAGSDLGTKLFYFRLSAILRRYIARRYDVPAAEMTTEELLPCVGRLPLARESVQQVSAFCTKSDPIKFADAGAAPSEMRQDLVWVEQFVRQTTPPPVDETGDQPVKTDDGQHQTS